MRCKYTLFFAKMQVFTIYLSISLYLLLHYATYILQFHIAFAQKLAFAILLAVEGVRNG